MVATGPEVRGKIARAFAPVAPEIFYHPAKGTGQIVDKIEATVKRFGGRFLFNTHITHLSHMGRRVYSAVLKTAEERLMMETEFVISSAPLNHLAGLLGRPQGQSESSLGTTTTDITRRSTVLVYLFLKEPPLFPHVWLEVSTPARMFRRITNYAALNGEMVPPGYTCLCAEAFCNDGDPLLSYTNEILVSIAVHEIAAARLIDPNQLFDTCVIRLPYANAAIHADNWKGQAQQRLLEEVNYFENLYYVNRAGIDVSMYAGLEAATAILSGDRGRFDKLTNPARDYD